jgi:hypothetical protein
MSKLTEQDMFRAFRKLAKVYQEQTPQDAEAIEHFVIWCHQQYGYAYHVTEQQK